MLSLQCLWLPPRTSRSKRERQERIKLAADLLIASHGPKNALTLAKKAKPRARPYRGGKELGARCAEGA